MVDVGERMWRPVNEQVYLISHSNATETCRELDACFRFYDNQEPHQALVYETPAEVFHGGFNPPSEESELRKSSPEEVLVSLAGTACLSLNSTQMLSK